jgi:hypothetical protein
MLLASIPQLGATLGFATVDEHMARLLDHGGISQALGVQELQRTITLAVSLITID